MVFSNKPLKFIVATLIACLPFFGFSNAVQDSTRMHVAKGIATNKPAGEHNEESGIKEQIKEVIDHHLLDSHDFS
ncbi:MAG TPA: ATP synthase F0 subunit A, partial [Flavobacterium sp.]